MFGISLLQKRVANCVSDYHANADEYGYDASPMIDLLNETLAELQKREMRLRILDKVIHSELPSALRELIYDAEAVLLKQQIRMEN